MFSNTLTLIVSETGKDSKEIQYGYQDSLTGPVTRFKEHLACMAQVTKADYEKTPLDYFNEHKSKVSDKVMLGTKSSQLKIGEVLKDLEVFLNEEEAKQVVLGCCWWAISMSFPLKKPETLAFIVNYLKDFARSDHFTIVGVSSLEARFMAYVEGPKSKVTLEFPMTVDDFHNTRAWFALARLAVVSDDFFKEFIKTEKITQKFEAHLRAKKSGKGDEKTLNNRVRCAMNTLSSAASPVAAIYNGRLYYNEIKLSVDFTDFDLPIKINAFYQSKFNEKLKAITDKRKEIQSLIAEAKDKQSLKMIYHKAASELFKQFYPTADTIELLPGTRMSYPVASKYPDYLLRQYDSLQKARRRRRDFFHLLSGGNLISYKADSSYRKFTPMDYEVISNIKYDGTIYHAEQQAVLDYLIDEACDNLKSGTLLEQFFLPVSRPCCMTCTATVQWFGFVLKGTHNEAFPNVEGRPFTRGAFVERLKLRYPTKSDQEVITITKRFLELHPTLPSLQRVIPGEMTVKSQHADDSDSDSDHEQKSPKTFYKSELSNPQGFFKARSAETKGLEGLVNNIHQQLVELPNKVKSNNDLNLRVFLIELNEKIILTRKILEEISASADKEELTLILAKLKKNLLTLQIPTDLTAHLKIKNTCFIVSYNKRVVKMVELCLRYEKCELSSYTLPPTTRLTLSPFVPILFTELEVRDLRKKNKEYEMCVLSDTENFSEMKTGPAGKWSKVIYIKLMGPTAFYYLAGTMLKPSEGSAKSLGLSKIPLTEELLSIHFDKIVDLIVQSGHLERRVEKDKRSKQKGISGIIDPAKTQISTPSRSVLLSVR